MLKKKMICIKFGGGEKLEHKNCFLCFRFLFILRGSLKLKHRRSLTTPKVNYTVSVKLN